MLSVFFSSKCSLFHNSNVFGSCIIHILYIYSTNIGTEYFKQAIYSLFFSLQNAVCFIILTYLVPVLFTFYIQGVLKLKKNNSGTKRLRTECWGAYLDLMGRFKIFMLPSVRQKTPTMEEAPSYQTTRRHMKEGKSFQSKVISVLHQQ